MGTEYRHEGSSLHVALACLSSALTPVLLNALTFPSQMTQLMEKISFHLSWAEGRE